MIFGNMAVFARSLHLGRFAVAAVFFLFLFVSGVSARCVERTFSNGSPGICTVGGYNPISCTVTNTGDTDRYGCPGNLTAGCWSDLPYSTNCVATSTGCNWQFCAWLGSVWCCSSQCEGDSVACVSQGYTWDNDPSAECGKSCTSCDEQCQCEEQGMIWTGTECIEDTTVCVEKRKLNEELCI